MRFGICGKLAIWEIDKRGLQTLEIYTYYLPSFPQKSESLKPHLVIRVSFEMVAKSAGTTFSAELMWRHVSFWYDYLK